MTKKFNDLYESILGDLAASATLMPVGPITVSQEPVDGEIEDCEGDCEEDLDDEITETEIASKIITHIKKLRKQIGEDTYYRARQIQDLAEKLLEMHPEIEVVEPVGESHIFKPSSSEIEEMKQDYKKLMIALQNLPVGNDPTDEIGRARMLIQNKLQHIKQSIGM
jgi:hypothetical protein